MPDTVLGTCTDRQTMLCARVSVKRAPISVPTLLFPICHRKQNILPAGSELIERAPISLGTCLSLYDATCLFSESEPKELAGENLNQLVSISTLHPPHRLLHTFATGSEKSAVSGSNYKAPSRANFLLNYVLHS